MSEHILGHGACPACQEETYRLMRAATPVSREENDRLRAINDDLLAALEAARPKLRHETDACPVVSVGTCARCVADAALAKNTQVTGIRPASD